MLRVFKHLLLCTAMLACAASGTASELVYSPINPTFGGNPNNAAILLEQARANNRHKEPKEPQKSATQAIADNIVNSVMSQVANQVATAIGNGDQSGTFQIGNSTISFVNNGAFTTLTINDGNGGITTVDIPNGI
jgi:curli production assembly/transport component CsgF